MSEQKCPKCNALKPRESFRKKATPAQKKRWNKEWINTRFCYTCSKPVTKKILGPVGLFKQLTNAGLPAPVIEHRVAVRAHIHKEKRISSLRATWRAKHALANAACIDALNQEAAMVRNALDYILRTTDLTGSSPVTSALAQYGEVIFATRVAIRERAREGKTPPAVWHALITPQQKLELRSIFNQAIENTTDPWLRGYAGRALPSWWSEAVPTKRTKKEK
jgi:hypothetical protein